ncbi:MAG: hypothetical protein ACI8ZM_002638 [Crocinitomix sp.]|jgi:uncharacterized protein (DUF2141 family)
MVKLLSIVLVGICCLTLVSFDEDADQADSKLTVLFDNIRNKEGKIYVFIYNYENQYPDNPYLNFEINKQVVSDFGTLLFTIPESLSKGNYAISVLDDENENDDLDFFLGLPLEGYGFSNNVAPFLSMPKYDDLLFDLSSNKKTINLTLQYFI